MAGRGGDVAAGMIAGGDVFKREGFCPPFFFPRDFFGDFFCDATVFDGAAPCASASGLPISVCS